MLPTPPHSILPINISSIGAYAFNKCSSITNINLKNVETVDEFAFYQCENLDYLVLGSSLKELKTSSFSGCGLKEEIDAYCERPSGYDKAIDDTSSVTLFVLSSVTGSWTGYSYQVLDEQNQPEENYDWGPVVIAGIAIILVAAGIISIIIRRKMFNDGDV